MASTFSDYSDYLSYTPQGGDLLLARYKHEIYHIQGEEILYAIPEPYLIGFEWNLIFSFTNHTNTEVIRTLISTRGLTVTQGSEVSKELSLTAGFQGVGISMGTSRKNFQSTEVSDVSSVETRITCPPNITTYYYQRLYKFRTYVWYILDAWNKLSGVGGMPINGQANYTLTFSETRSEIKSEDYFLTHVSPRGSGTFPGSASPPPQPIQGYQGPRQFTTTTDKTQDYLRGLANRGMAFISGYNRRSALIPDTISTSPEDAAARKKSEGDGAEFIGVEHPIDKNQDEFVSITNPSSDAPSK